MLKFQRVRQLTDSHCGPAVIQMLLDALGVMVSQEDVVEAAGVTNRIKVHGTRVDQLAAAVAKLAPQASFWYKYYSNFDDIRYILQRGYAVAVEWQGLFYDSFEEEEEDGGPSDTAGHYSIISHIDDETQQMIIVDSYKEFAQQDRIFAIREFLPRWWDTNEVRNPYTGRREIITDEQLMFFITPSEEIFDPERKFQRYGTVEGEQGEVLMGE